MSINQDQVKVYESERLTDETDGGGRATGKVVVDGEINNLFPDISRLDRTTGDVALRKGFVGVDTDNSDTYLGAHAILVDPPADPRVHVLLFDAGSEDDERADAQQRIEAYVVQGARAQFELLGNQYENQRQIVCVQREEQALPSTGDVFVLRNDEDAEQYVRVTSVEAVMQPFAYFNGQTWTDYLRRRVVLGISAPLETTYPGGEVTPNGTAMPAGTTRDKSEVFTTEVADAARYWGVKRSSETGNIGDVKIKVPSIYANLVPSAQSEQPLADQPLGAVRQAVRASADEAITVALTAQYISSTEVRVYLPRAAVRRTVQLSIGGSNYTDNGDGTMVRTSGTYPFSELEIDHATGLIMGTRNSGTHGTGGTIGCSATFMPGVAFSGRAETYRFPVTLNNRAYNYVTSFTAAKPRPGTMTISYMVLGKWYELRDAGSGVLEGEGSGTLDFTTGTVTVTLSALPDVGSSILYAYVMDLEDEFEYHNGTVATAIPEVEVQLLPGVAPSSVSIGFMSGEESRTITDDGSGGLTGYGTGTVDYATGLVRFKPTAIHDDGTNFTASYNVGGAHSMTVPKAAIVSNVAAGALSETPVQPGTVSLLLSMGSPQPQYQRRIKDDGQGGFEGATGTINYSTGEYSVDLGVTKTLSRERPVYEWDEGNDLLGILPAKRIVGWENYTVNQSYSVASDVEIAWITASPQTAPESTTFSPDELELLLVDNSDDNLVPGSLLFEYGGVTYFDRDGILYHSPDSKTGAGTAVGQVDYQARTVTLNTWTGGSGPGVTIRAAATAAKDTLVARISGRTPGAPLRPESFQISVTDGEGNIITDTADNDGLLSGASLNGHIDYQTGVYTVDFTTDPQDDTGDSDVPVFANTGRYNAVLYSFLPLDAELIGLDPVRLPSDGRVPIYREGDVIVLSHTEETDAGTPTAGQQVTLARDHQAHIEVVDSAGLKLDPVQYTANKLTGTVTFADPLTLETEGAITLTPPLTIKDRVEHMSVINDVQINGTLSFIAPLAHEFPAEETVVSSALVWGDINSRVFNFFKQKTWNSSSPNWGPDRVGDDTSANYNLVDNPIEYANNGAITEKWALVFTSSTAFNIVGQTLGIIGTGNTSVDVAPVNPNTGNPYFVMRAAGFGSGWASGNAIRFDTEGCLAPMWICRTVLSGQAEVADDKFTIQIRGDAD